MTLRRISVVIHHIGASVVNVFSPVTRPKALRAELPRKSRETSDGSAAFRRWSCRWTFAPSLKGGSGSSRRQPVLPWTSAAITRTPWCVSSFSIDSTWKGSSGQGAAGPELFEGGSCVVGRS